MASKTASEPLSAYPRVRTAYQYEKVAGQTFSKPSMTKQSAKAECDINNILVKYQKTGVFDHVRQYEGQYFEASESDYHDAMNTVVRANEMFADLPSKARDYFGNDPAKFLAFFDENQAKSINMLYDLGLAVGTRNGSDKPPYDDRPPAPDVENPVGSTTS